MVLFIELLHKNQSVRTGKQPDSDTDTVMADPCDGCDRQTSRSDLVSSGVLSTLLSSAASAQFCSPPKCLQGPPNGDS